MQNISIIEKEQTWNEVIVELNLQGKDYRLIKGGTINSSMNLSTLQNKVVLIEGFNDSNLGDLLKLQKNLSNSELIIYSTFFGDLTEKNTKRLIPYLDMRVCTDTTIYYGRINKYKFSKKKPDKMMN